MHPALAAQGAPRKVLVLGGGDGLAVREVLKHPAVERVVLVELDPHIVRLFRDRDGLAPLNDDALRSPKLTIVQADAFTWLDANDEMFDVIVIDFPDPTNFSLGKLYTTSFYERVDRHLAAGGFAVVQTTSPLLARRSFWTVVSTIEAVGLTATPYHAHVPSFGEWGFVLMGRRPWTPPRALPPGLRFLTVDGIAGAAAIPARHGARGGAAEPAVEPGAGAHLRRRMGQGAPITRRRGACRRRRWAVARRCAGRLRARRADRVRRCMARRVAPARPPRCATAARPLPARADAPMWSSSAAASRAWRARARWRAAASTTSCCSTSKTPSAATAAATRWAASRCPLGAHYLPVPGRDAREVQRAAVRARAAAPRGRAHGRRRTPPVPQPAGAPVLRWRVARRPAAAGRAGLAHAAAVPRVRARGRARAARARIRAADAAGGVDRWPSCARCAARSRNGWRSTGSTTRSCAGTLDYACRDDYGAGVSEVSAWAGLHYFASRHGFSAPGDDAMPSASRSSPGPRATPGWSSAWPSRCTSRVHGAHAVLQVNEERHGVQVLAFDERAQHAVAFDARRSCSRCRCSSRGGCCAPRCRRLMRPWPQRRHAPWLVANLQLRRAVARACDRRAAGLGQRALRCAVARLRVGAAPEPAHRRPRHGADRRTGRCRRPSGRRCSATTGGRGRGA